VSAAWYGSDAISEPASAAFVPLRRAKVVTEQAIREREASDADRVRRAGLPYQGFVGHPEDVVVKGLPAQRYRVRRTEADGRVTQGEHYAIFKGRTPFGLRCLSPSGEEVKAREICRLVLRSLRLGTAPVTN